MKRTIPLANDVIRIASYLKTSLGPRGKDKIIINDRKNLNITNDGATIITGLPYSNVALTILRDVCRVQDSEVGDGTTTICCLVSELLIGFNKLLSLGFHPKKVVSGFRNCALLAVDTIFKYSIDQSDNLENFSAKLISLARTTFSSKILFPHHEFFSRMVIKSILQLKGSSNLKRIKFLKITGGTLLDSFLEEGYLIEKKLGVSSLKKCFDAKILIVNTQMDYDKIKISGSKIMTKNLTSLAQLEISEQKKILDKCKKIISTKANLLINRQLIYDIPEQFLTNNGLMTLENADFEGVETLSLLTDAEISSTFDEPNSIRLGKCKLVEEKTIGNKQVTKFSGCQKGGACSIVLRGSSLEILNEAERSLHDVICVVSQVLKNPWMIYGAGFSEGAIASELKKKGSLMIGMKSLIYEECSNSFLQIPKIIAENSGLDPLKIINNLIDSKSNGPGPMVIDIVKGRVTDPSELNVVESSKLKIQTVLSAFEAVEMISRIDKMFVN